MAYQSEIEKLTRRWNENPEQYFAPLADAYRKAGEIDLALEVVRAGLAKRPNYVSAHIVLGRCLLDQKNDPEAAKVFEQVLQLDAENIIAIRILGEIAERGHDAGLALSWLKRLLEVDPMNDDAQEAIQRLEAAAPAPAVAEAPVAEAGQPADVAAVAGFEATALDASPAAAGAEAAAGFAIERSDGSVEFGGPPSAPAVEMEPIQLEQPAGGITPAGAEPGEPGAIELEELTERQPEASAPEAVPLEEALVLPEEPAAPPHAPARASASWKKEDLPQDLPLLLPEEEAPPSAGPGPPPAVVGARAAPEGPPPPAEAIEPEPVITETMAEVYLRQGLVREAREVYRKLVEQRPGDAALRARLEALDQREPAAGVVAPAARSGFAAAETGGVPARSFFSRLLTARPGVAPAGAGAGATQASGADGAGGPASPASGLEAAFAEEPPPVAGAPTSPAVDELSLASVFGEEPAPSKPASATPPSPPGGFSFDEFFGGTPAPAPSGAPPKAAASPPPATDADSGGSEDFVSWLKGLKS